MVDMPATFLADDRTAYLAAAETMVMRASVGVGSQFGWRARGIGIAKPLMGRGAETEAHINEASPRCLAIGMNRKIAPSTASFWRKLVLMANVADLATL